MNPMRCGPSRTNQRGVGLIEALIALVILSFGILGLAKFQTGMLAQTTDTQSRLVATSYSDELLSQVRVDPSNAACYTLPQSGTCGSTFAKAQAADWAARAASAGFASATASMPSTSRLTATLTWTSKAFSETRTLEATTDVRP